MVTKMSKFIERALKKNMATEQELKEYNPSTQRISKLIRSRFQR